MEETRVNRLYEYDNLGDVQRSILVHLLAAYHRAESIEAGRAMLEAHGVEWREAIRPPETRSESASWSRGLRQLEARDLVVRWNPEGRRQAVFVELTPTGRRMAEWLAKFQRGW